MTYEDLTIGQIEAVVKKLGGVEGVKRFLCKEVAVQTAQFGLSITVNYNLSLTEMIAVGRYDWVDSNITANLFPEKGEGTKELAVELIHFDRFVSSDEAVKEMDKRDLRPAIYMELLAFGAKYPDMQRGFDITALGSIALAHGYRRVLSLYRDDFKRRLNFCWWDANWYGYSRFLAVPN